MNERFETFTVLVNRISRNIRRIENQEMAEYGLRSTHSCCLYYLYAFGSMTAAQLCEHCEEDKATVSRTVEYLEKNGYLYRDSPSAKRYKSPLLLTEKGLQVGRHMALKLDSVLSGSNHGLTEAELAAFYKSLSTISENLETIAQKLSSETTPDPLHAHPLKNEVGE